MSSVGISPAAVVTGPDDLARVVEILVGAFYDDPLWAWGFPDPDRRRDQQRRLWELYVAGAARYPTVWLNAERTSTAVWIPPGGTDLSPAQELLVEPLLVDLLGTAGADRVARLGEAFDRAHPHDADHYYLTLLGTDPAHRGKGSGLRLLADTLPTVDAAGVPAYLEASNPGNVALYERYGFRVHGRVEVPDGGPEVITMLRPPRTSG